MCERPLTDEELEYVLDFITPARHLPVLTALSIATRQRNSLLAQLRSIKLHPQAVDDLKDEIQRQYATTLIQPGESVGILTAQSIGERQTQSTLNTFHSTGLTIATVVTGVPRFEQLLNATQKPNAKSSTIYYKTGTTSIRALRDRVGSTLRQITLKSIRTSVDISNQPRADAWYSDYVGLFYGFKYRDHPWSIRWTLDMDKMYEYQVTLREIAQKLEENIDDLIVVFSPEQHGIIDVYVDTSHLSFNPEVYRTEEEAISVYLEDVVLGEIEKYILFGIEGINDIIFDRKGEEWVVQTDGSNLSQVFALPDVDFARTVSNHMWEIFNCLGIEAARNFLLREFNGVVSSDGNFVHVSHTMLLVDIMTFQGTLVAINRYGLKKEHCGPLAKASFEEVLDHFLRAGSFGEKENTKSVSASIMLGKTGKFGTGICDLVVNVDQLPGTVPVLADHVMEKL